MTAVNSQSCRRLDARINTCITHTKATTTTTTTTTTVVVVVEVVVVTLHAANCLREKKKKLVKIGNGVMGNFGALTK